MVKVFMRLTLRDLRRTLGLRQVLIWSALTATGIFFFFTTGGKTELLQKNRVEFMALFLPQILFGAWAVLSVYFDLIAADRQRNVLDMILCSGVSKPMVFCGKITSMAISALALSAVYLLPLSIVVESQKAGYGAAVTAYILPLWCYILVYAALGLFISVIARSAKAALIASLAAGLVLMPRFYMLIVEGIGSALGLTAAAKETLGNLSPGIMMESLAHGSDPGQPVQTVLWFAAGILLLTTAAFAVFCRQDEHNYGE